MITLDPEGDIKYQISFAVGAWKKKKDGIIKVELYLMNEWKGEMQWRKRKVKTVLSICLESGWSAVLDQISLISLSSLVPLSHSASSLCEHDHNN